MNEKKKNKNNPLSFYAKYSALAFEMIIIIVAGAFGGRELDKVVNWNFPVFTLILTLLAAAGAILFGVRELFKKK
ncbi:MAG: AtpZ/AtpI family protein [Bacteroidales bacterium]|nr:AtpZ/AtpI family protein [Bacteroidales bacterium]